MKVIMKIQTMHKYYFRIYNKIMINFASGA